MDLSVHGTTTKTEEHTQGSTTIHLQLLVNIEGLRMMLNGGKCNIFGLYISVCYRRVVVVVRWWRKARERAFYCGFPSGIF